MQKRSPRLWSCQACWQQSLLCWSSSPRFESYWSRWTLSEKKNKDLAPIAVRKEEMPRLWILCRLSQPIPIVLGTRRTIMSIRTHAVNNEVKTLHTNNSSLFDMVDMVTVWSGPAVTMGVPGEHWNVQTYTFKITLSLRRRGFHFDYR